MAPCTEYSLERSTLSAGAVIVLRACGVYERRYIGLGSAEKVKRFDSHMISNVLSGSRGSLSVCMPLFMVEMKSM